MSKYQSAPAVHVVVNANGGIYIVSSRERERSKRI